MGADGGIIIYKFKDVCEKWEEVKQKLHILFSTEVKEEKERYNHFTKTYCLTKEKNESYNLEKANKIKEYDIQDKTCK
jgi:putative sterol carrier protein